MTDPYKPKFAVYRHDPLERRIVDGYYWLADTGVGGTWSTNVDDAEWFDSPRAAVDALHACDIVERGVDPHTLGFFFPRVQ